MATIITGLDIGSSQIKGIIAERRKDGTLFIISAFKHPSSGLRKGVLVNVEDTGRILRELIRELKQISKDAVRNIYININSEHVKVNISRGISAVSQPDKEINQEDVDRAVQASRAAKILPNYKALHTIVREFMVDEIGDIQNPVGMTGSRLEVSTLLVEAFAPHFDVLVNTLESSGATLGGVVFDPLASSRAVLSKKQKELGVLAIDFGFGTTSFAAFEENKPIYAKSFPLGSNHLTNDIAIGLKTSVDIAEKLKLNFGTAASRGVSRRDLIKIADFDSSLSDEVPRRFLSEIIEVRVAEILDIINNELEPIKSRFQFPAGVVMTGGGIKLEGLTDLVRHEMKLPAQIGLPKIDIFEIDKPSYENLIDDSEFATTVGLILIANDEMENKPRGPVNFCKKVFKNLVP